LLKVYSASHPSITAKEGAFAFVECATLADDVKYKGGGWQSEWHFIDQPWFSNGDNASDYPDFKGNPRNTTFVLPQLAAIVRGDNKVPVNGSYVLAVMERKFETDLEMRSFALRVLVHLVGDIHQPQHVTTRVNADFPEGDKGGNEFTLKYHYGASDLHAVWDSLIYKFHSPVKLPFDEEQWEAFGAVVQNLTQKHEIAPQEYEDMNFTHWAMQSYSLAPEIYKGV